MSSFNSFTAAVRRQLPAQHILCDPADTWVYSYDNGRHRGIPAAIIFAQTHEEVVHIVQCAREYQVPLVVRGRGTGTPGGSVPIISGSVVLSLERMQKILEINSADRYIRVQPGVLNQTVQDTVMPHGLFWAPDPGSAPFCTVGGNLAYNAGGPRAVKYGATREHVLGLTTVLGTGDTMHCGGITTKGATGYDLTRLMIGSEGTLGIITEAILKLTPLPPQKTTLYATYEHIASAINAVVNIMRQPYTPCALELMDAACLRLIEAQGIHLFAGANALLLIDVDGDSASLPLAIQHIQYAAQQTHLLSFSAAENSMQAKQFWAARKALSPALRQLASKKINEDVVVPITKIPTLFEKLQRLSEKYQIQIVNFGHAGNGNMHVNLLAEITQLSAIDIQACLNELFETVIALGGTLSGEHGIGIEKRDFIPKALDPVMLKMMRAIKAQFDPQQILNPGKIFPATNDF